MLRLLLICGMCFLSLPHSGTFGASVMSVDLGMEWMKIAVVSPGVPMEIALNVESKRKTAMAVSLRDGERAFGSEALVNFVRYPKTCYAYFLDILAKPLSHPSVQDFSRRFPYFDLEEDPVTGRVVFKHAEGEYYSPEELLSMVLTHAKEIAEAYTGQKIKETVITIPVFFNEAEKISVKFAASMAGLDTLQLISEPLAVSLNYGMFRRKEINATAKNIIFYDMGAQDTTVSIVSFQIIKTKERGFSETHPQAQILGVAYDRSLGGLELQFRIRDLLADKFNELKKTKTDVRTVPRAMGKLFKEAGRVKNVLSANANLYAQIENVMEDIDFKVPISRSEFYEMVPEFFERATVVLDEALKNAGGMQLEEVSEVILVGAGTRVPKIQEVLKEKVKSELGKNLNTDESAAMGAVYKAADLSTGFKVKKFITKEVIVFPIDVDFKREYIDDEGNQKVKFVKRSLFSKGSSYPQKKIMTFNKFTEDFTFNVNLNDIEYLGELEVNRIGPLNLTEVRVKGVAAALENNTGSNIESKGVKAHFVMDESGLLSISSVEAVFEKTISVEEQEEEEKKFNITEAESVLNETDKELLDAWSKLGDTWTSFFGEKPKSEEEDSNSTETPKDKTSTESSDKTKEKKKQKKKEPKKPKVVIIKEPLEFEVTNVHVPHLSQESIEVSIAKLRALDEMDAKKKAQENAVNALESFVVDMKVNLEEDLYQKSTTTEEREDISKKLSEVSDWIDEEVGPFTETKILEEKLESLKELTSSLSARIREYTHRPEALESLRKVLNTSETFLAKARNNSQWFSEAELQTMGRKNDATKEWLEQIEKEFEEQPMHEMPKTTLSMITDKIVDLEREVKYLVNKARIAKAEERRKKDAEEKLVKEAERKKKEKSKKQKKLKNETEEASSETEGDNKSDEKVEDEKIENAGDGSGSEKNVENSEDAENGEPLPDGDEGLDKEEDNEKEKEPTDNDEENKTDKESLDDDNEEKITNKEEL